MITATSAAPAVTTAANFSDYRFRPVAGERTILPGSTPAAPKTPTSHEDASFMHDASAEPNPHMESDPSAMFAAAVISGALSPTPKTMEELVRRIGTSPIPEEFEARIKDLLA